MSTNTQLSIPLHLLPVTFSHSHCDLLNRREFVYGTKNLANSPQLERSWTPTRKPAIDFLKSV